jgi:hypothetical protein
MSLNSSARATGNRHGVRIGLRLSATALSARLQQCLTEFGAKRHLATVWKTQSDALEHIEQGRFRRDPHVEHTMQLTATATLTMLSAPAFDEVPLIGLGLRLSTTGEEPTWTGRPASIKRAAATLEERGLTMEPDDGVTRARRGEAPFATMIEDPAFEPSPRDGGAAAPKPAIALRALALLLAMSGLVLAGLTRPLVMLPFLIAAAVAVIVDRVRSARARRFRIARLTPRAANSTGAPYRGDTHVRDRIETSALLECLRDAGFTAEARSTALRITGPARVALELIGLRGASAQIDELQLRFTEPVAAIRCAHALSASLGPLMVTIDQEDIEIRSPDQLDGWLAQHERDRLAIERLVAALAQGRDSALVWL